MGTRVSYYRRAVNLLGRAGLISESGSKTVALISKDEDSTDDDYYYYLESEHGHHGAGQSAAAKVRLFKKLCWILFYQFKCI